MHSHRHESTNSQHDTKNSSDRVENDISTDNDKKLPLASKNTEVDDTSSLLSTPRPPPKNPIPFVQLSKFDHVDGCKICEGLFPHFKLPDGSYTHYYHRDHLEEEVRSNHSSSSPPRCFSQCVDSRLTCLAHVNADPRTGLFNTSSSNGSKSNLHF